MFYDIRPRKTAFFSIHFLIAFSADATDHFGKYEVSILIVRRLTRGGTYDDKGLAPDHHNSSIAGDGRSHLAPDSELES